MSAAPNPARIFETLNAYQRSAALKGAIDLDLFTLIAEVGGNLQEIAVRCQADPRALRILSDFLVIDQYLIKSGNEYSLTPTAALFLNRHSEHYMGSVARFMHSDDLLDAFKDVAGIVRQGGTLLSQNGTIETEYDGWVAFAENMVPMMRAPAEFIADLVSVRKSGPIRVLDVAAGHGLFGISIAQKNIQAEIVALDWPNVLQVASRNAERAGVSARLQELPGNAFHVNFGGRFDVVLLTNFLHHFNKEECRTLMKKVSQCLNPQGLVVTLEFIPNEDRVSPPPQAMFAMTMLGTTPEGDAYTFAEYQEMWQSAGIDQHELFDVPHSAQRVVVSQSK